MKNSANSWMCLVAALGLLAGLSTISGCGNPSSEVVQDKEKKNSPMDRVEKSKKGELVPPPAKP